MHANESRISSRTPLVLVATSEPDLSSVVEGELRPMRPRIITESDGFSAWTAFERTTPDAVIASATLPGISGIELLSRMRAAYRTLFILHTSDTDAAQIFHAARSGADDVFATQDGSAQIPQRIRDLLFKRLGASNRAIADGMIVGRCAEMLRVKARLCALVELRVPALVVGEPGSGRDQVAECIACIDTRCKGDRSLIRISRDRPFLRSDAGRVVYLDEVQNLSRSSQSSWLQQILGSERGDSAAPYRVVASTSADLFSLAHAGSFDPGLASRLAQFSLVLPPLRSRGRDIHLLAQHLVRGAGWRMGRPMARLSHAALRELSSSSSWPGNVCELRDMMERLVAFSESGLISKTDVVRAFEETPGGVGSHRSLARQQMKSELEELLRETGGNLAEVARRLGMSRGAIIYRAQKFGLLPERRRRAGERGAAARSS